MTRPTARKIITELSVLYGVRLHFEKTKDQQGESRFWNNSISINLNQSGISMLSTFFHEIGHIHCFKNGIWKSFHINKTINKMTKDEKRKYLLTALKSERWIDRWAEKEMKNHFPKLKYIYSYPSDVEYKEFTESIKKLLGYEN